MRECSSPERCFTFEPPAGEVSRGSFFLHEPTLRAAFRDMGNAGLFGCRYLKADGGSVDVPFMDPRRRAFQDMCILYGQCQRNLSAFQDLVEPRAGLVVNSLQNPKARSPYGFNDIARMFIKNVGGVGGVAEELDLVLFFGTYDSGFGVHKDAYDTTMFVLDGRKNFLLERGERQQHSLEAGNYLRWTSACAHTNFNPSADWSMTLHFTLGPAASRHIEPGTAVEYIHKTVTLKDFEASISAPRSNLRKRT